MSISIKESEFTDYSENILKMIIDNGLPIVIWGFGGMISFIIDNLNQYGVHVDYIVENNIMKCGNSYENIPIISFTNLKDCCSDVNILIGVATKRYVNEICNQIRMDGQFNRVYFCELFYPFGDYAKKLLLDNYDSIIEVYDLLEDQKSREIYEKKLKYVLNKASGILKEIQDEETDQYFDEQLVHLDNVGGLFIDGGSYHGENADELYKRFTNTKLKTICIDADLNNVEYLREKYRDNSNIIVKFGALEEKNGEICFSNSGDRGGMVSTDGKGEKIPCISIDDEFLGAKVSFIKLDIEGSEEKCLIGARKTISSYKPVLAICIYHTIEDHWRIPLLIKSIRSDYKIYIRHYHYMGIETVVYAI